MVELDNIMNKRILIKYLLTLPFVQFLQLSANNGKVIEICPGEFFEVPDNWNIIYSKSATYTTYMKMNGKLNEYRMDYFKFEFYNYTYLCSAIEYKNLKEFKKSFNNMQKLSTVINGKLLVDGCKIGILVG